MIKYVLIILFMNPDNTQDIYETRYLLGSEQECLVAVGKVAIAITGKRAFVQTFCIPQDDLDAQGNEDKKVKQRAVDLFTI